MHRADRDEYSDGMLELEVCYKDFAESALPGSQSYCLCYEYTNLKIIAFGCLRCAAGV